MKSYLNRLREIRVVADGWKFIISFGLFGLALIFFDTWFPTLLGILFFIFSIFCVYFFRDSKTQAVEDPNYILSPANGRVMDIAKINGEGFGQGWAIRIFLSVFDVHVQRSPVTGKVGDVHYKQGVFLDARDPRAPFTNEQNSVTITADKGKVMVKQIAGLLARRILCWVKHGDEIKMGEHIGLIRFGSQVDLYIPENCKILVREGDRVEAALPIAQWQ